MGLKPFKVTPTNDAEWNRYLRAVPVSPDDDTVNTGKIQDGAVTPAKTALAGADGQFLVRRGGAQVYDVIQTADVPAAIARVADMTAGDTATAAAATLALANHVIAADPHPLYLLKADAITLYGATTGTFVVTLTGATTTVTGTAIWSKVGKLVVLQIPVLSGTSNATTATLTGAPAGIQPAHAQRFYVPVLDNSVNAMGTVEVETSGVLTLGTGFALAAMTNSGAKGTLAFTITYSLD